ncbi:uncharacterized protein LOC114195117 [Vigna unguiculata]|uniref:uncharacterized protein LOC114195117 n=1 Tax=Vigna unguiculata TaxID=3917 RepID=UPI001015D6EB|nr:uncharacterized protein LOC114195117 [Vigna unguiculata]
MNKLIAELKTQTQQPSTLPLALTKSSARVCPKVPFLRARTLSLFTSAANRPRDSPTFVVRVGAFASLNPRWARFSWATREWRLRYLAIWAEAYTSPLHVFFRAMALVFVVFRL